MTTVHGTLTAYTNHKCRCAVCRAGWAAYTARWRAGKSPADVPHGTLGGYTNYRCRCETCRPVFREYLRGWRAERKARSAA